MEKVTKEEYISAKESGEMTPDVLDIIERASKFGIKTDDEMIPNGPEEIVIEDEQEAEVINGLLSVSDVPVITDDHRQVAEENERLRLDNERFQNEISERDKLAENYIGSTDKDSTDNVLDMFNSLKLEDYESGYALMQAQLGAIAKVLPEIANRNSNDPEMRKVFDMVEGIEQQKEEEENKRRETEKDRLVDEEVSDFWKSHSDYKTDATYKDSTDEYYAFASKIAQDMGFDTNQLQLFLTKLAQPSTKGKLVSVLKDKNITIPGCFDRVYNTITVMDYKDGVKINPTTGEAEEIKDRYGKRQTLPDLDLAYHAMNRNSILASQKRQAILEVSERSQKLDSGANTFSASRLDSISPDDVMGAQEIARILADVRENPKKYQTDPEAMARYDMAMKRMK
jgi:hypothetical protein